MSFESIEEKRRLHLEAQARRDEEARLRREEERVAKSEAYRKQKEAEAAERLAAKEAQRAAISEAYRKANAQDRDKRMRPKEPDIPTPPPASVTAFGTINNVLTPELRDALVEQRAQCLPPETAAARCRVPIDVLYAWLATGRADVAKGEATLFADLVLSLDQGAAEAEATLIGHVRGGDNWQSAKWLMEQSNPAAWGKNVQTVDVNVRAAGVIVAANVQAMSMEEILQLEAAAERRLAETKEARRLTGPSGAPRDLVVVHEEE